MITKKNYLIFEGKYYIYQILDRTKNYHRLVTFVYKLNIGNICNEKKNWWLKKDSDHVQK